MRKGNAYYVGSEVKLYSYSCYKQANQPNDKVKLSFTRPSWDVRPSRHYSPLLPIPGNLFSLRPDQANKKTNKQNTEICKLVNWLGTNERTNNQTKLTEQTTSRQAKKRKTILKQKYQSIRAHLIVSSGKLQVNSIFDNKI